MKPVEISRYAVWRAWWLSPTAARGAAGWLSPVIPLLLGSLLCGAALGDEHGMSGSAADARSESEGGLVVDDPAEGWVPALPPLESLREIIERPLFSSNRRPDEPEVEESSTGPVKETWKLSGVVIEGDQPLALLKEREGERRLKLGVGMYLDDWQVEAIEDHQLILVSGEERIELPLREPREVSQVNGREKAGTRARVPSPVDTQAGHNNQAESQQDETEPSASSSQNGATD